MFPAATKAGGQVRDTRAARRVQDAGPAGAGAAADALSEHHGMVPTASKTSTKVSVQNMAACTTKTTPHARPETSPASPAA